MEKNLAIFKTGDKEDVVAAAATASTGATSQRIFDWEQEFLSTNLEYLLRVEALSHLFLSQEQPFTQNTIDLRHCINVAPTEHAGLYHILRGELFVMHIGDSN